MEETMKFNLVNEVAGSIVSDKMLDKVDDLAQANRIIGNLEGELKVANQLLEEAVKEMDREVANASTKVEVTLAGHGASYKVLTRDRWGDLVYTTQHEPYSIDNITIDKERLSELADAAVIGQAKKDVEEAEKKVEVAEKQVAAIEKKIESVEKYTKERIENSQKNVDEERKQLKKSIETAVEYAQKSERKEIAALKLDIKALNAEVDLMIEEKENLARERDLAFEVYENKIRLLENRDSIQNRSNQTILDSVKKRMSMWSWNRKIKRLES